MLTRRVHTGPLRVQKPFYPEGETVCQVILLHPPGGIANGDALSLTTRVGAGAHALLTTPGAGKWYRSSGDWARQHVHLHVGPGAALEWLPQESILFDGARVDMDIVIDLSADARFIGWEVLCLGRRAAGESYRTGQVRLCTRLRRDGRVSWLERACFSGGSGLLASTAGLAGHSVSGSLIAAAPQLDDALLAACRAIGSGETQARTGITRLPGLMIARYLGHCSEAARDWFVALWRLLRPAMLEIQALPPRIWST